MTSFETVEKIYLNSIQDYRLQKLFKDDVNAAMDMVETFLFKSLSNFNNCIKDLASADFTNKTFTVDLDIDEINIISDLMVIAWMNWSINNITQMEMTLDDTDFKHYSEERNLSGKINHRNNLREIVDQAKTDYGLKHTPFKEWANGNYGL